MPLSEAPENKRGAGTLPLPGVIALDGPAASGKSTIGQRLALRLGYVFFDTGALYRAVTWLALTRGIAPGEEEAVSRLAETVAIDVRPPTVADGRQYDVWAEGTDITWKIRQPEVDANVSRVAAYPDVRKALTLQMRRIARRGRIVMVGRDIGTVVLPDADIKLYLDASAEERARRRWLEEQARGGLRSYEQVLDDVRRRDQIDSTRSVAPLRPADDAIIVDSTGLTVDQVVERIAALVSPPASASNPEEPPLPLL